MPRSSIPPAPRILIALGCSVAILVSCDGNGTVVGGTGPGIEDTEQVLLEVPQWNTNHNGGGLTFDNAGRLFLGLGDGGGSGDDRDNAQDATNLLGTILRLEVLENEPYYEAPRINPFTDAGDDRRDEIFAFGLRNPWRVTVDPGTNRIWTGDVGQNAFEEVNIVEAGGNYGWDCREGFQDFGGSSSDACDAVDPQDFIDPVFTYSHDSEARSITGGYVYRGTTLVDLIGKYVYADFITGEIWSLDPSTTPATNTPLVQAGFGISSFGLDADGEMYALEFATGGHLHRLESDGGGGYELVDAFPQLSFDNPVDLRHAGDGSGRLFVVEQAGTIRVFDVASPTSSSVFLDLTDQVVSGGEQGLLGLAFHPDFSTNGHFYVYYTTGSTDRVGRLSRFTVEGDG